MKEGGGGGREGEGEGGREGGREKAGLWVSERRWKLEHINRKKKKQGDENKTHKRKQTICICLPALFSASISNKWSHE